MNSRVSSLIAGLLLALTSCAVPHGWKTTHEDVAFRRDGSGAVIEKIDCERHLTHDLYWVSPEGVAADKWLEDHRDFYLVHADNSRTRLTCIPSYSNPRFFPLADGQWLVVWPNEQYIPAYGANMAVALLDTKGVPHNGIVRGRYYLARAPSSGGALTPTARPLPDNFQEKDINYKVEFENGNAIFKTYSGDFVFNFADGTLRPR